MKSNTTLSKIFKLLTLITTITAGLQGAATSSSVSSFSLSSSSNNSGLSISSSSTNSLRSLFSQTHAGMSATRNGGILEMMQEMSLTGSQIPADRQPILSTRQSVKINKKTVRAMLVANLSDSQIKEILYEGNAAITEEMASTVIEQQKAVIRRKSARAVNNSPNSGTSANSLRAKTVQETQVSQNSANTSVASESTVTSSNNTNEAPVLETAARGAQSASTSQPKPKASWWNNYWYVPYIAVKVIIIVAFYAGVGRWLSKKLSTPRPARA